MRRETYSSLKAADGAWRVAMGYLYRRPIDVMTLRCPGCGRSVDLGEVAQSGPMSCRGCGGTVEVPGYVAAEAQRRRAEGVAGDTSAWEEWLRDHPTASVRTSTARRVLIVILLLGWVVLMIWSMAMYMRH